MSKQYLVCSDASPSDASCIRDVKFQNCVSQWARLFWEREKTFEACQRAEQTYVIEQCSFWIFGKQVWEDSNEDISLVKIMMRSLGKEMTMTLEENTEASQPFFLSDIIRCVRVEKLEDPAQMTIEHDTEVGTIISTCPWWCRQWCRRRNARTLWTSSWSFILNLLLTQPL